MKNLYKKLYVFPLLLVFIHCGGSENIDDPFKPTPNLTPAPLVRYTSCSELLADLQKEALENKSCTYEYGYDGTDVGGTSSPSSDSDGSDVASETDFTPTNIQEKGVDEADIVKTDGEYLYVATKNGIEIFKARPFEEFGMVATYTIDGGVDEMFLHNNQLILLTNAYDYVSGEQTVTVTAVDVNDPSSPNTLWAKKVEGSYLQSRLVDDVLHVVFLAYFPRDNNCWDESDLDELSSEISNRPIEEWLPKYSTGEEWSPVRCVDFYKDDSNSYDSLTGLMSLNLNNRSEKEESMTFIKGYSYEVYASTESVFLASNSEGGQTNVHRFAIKDSDNLHEYTSSGAVSGTVLNSFSMSEYKDTLRIATTNGDFLWSASDPSNNVYILDTTKTNMPVVGEITGIAEGERIYAVRFIGNRGYVVTFKKIDPLFVLDLSDPKNPEIKGELKMPGYSTYLHPLGEDHLIGIGKDSDDMGDFAWFQGLKLAIFDVSDPSSPKIVDDLIIGSRGTESQALDDHHAFTFDPETGLLALPVTLYEGSSGGSDYGEFQYDGVHMYSLSATEGIETVAAIPITSASPWQNVYRTLMIGDDEEDGMYAVDAEHVYQINMSSYETTSTEDLSSSLSGSYYDFFVF